MSKQNQKKREDANASTVEAIVMWFNKGDKIYTDRQMVGAMTAKFVLGILLGYMITMIVLKTT